MAKSKTETNRAFVESARSNGRVEVRCWLPDQDSSEIYRMMAEKVPKRERGLLIGAMIKFAAQAQKRGDFKISDDGKVYINGESYTS